MTRSSSDGSRHPDRADALVVACAVVTSAYYYGGRWLLGEGIIGETAMMIVSAMTLLAGVPIAVYALLMIEDSLRGVPA